MSTRILAFALCSLVMLTAAAETTRTQTGARARAPISSMSIPLIAPRNRWFGYPDKVTTAPYGIRLPHGTTTGPRMMIGPYAPRPTPELDNEGYPKPRIRLLSK